VASRLRLSLFRSIVIQDMAFFDVQRTGELVNRLTNDVAEFKHSFKSCVSQGLKSVTQISGSLLQLWTISPQLTGTLMLCMPILYGLGNMYGSFLRKLSKIAKQKEGAAGGVAGEVRYQRLTLHEITYLINDLQSLSNIRTVRAFANEEHEVESFRKSQDEAASANIMLGYHIGIFQGFTNFSIGSMVLTVLHAGGNLVASKQITGGDLMSYLICIQNAQKSLGKARQTNSG
jgi:ATP-binding cassette subfamily B (MDR/TAP) protein 8